LSEVQIPCINGVAWLLQLLRKMGAFKCSLSVAWAKVEMKCKQQFANNLQFTTKVKFVMSTNLLQANYFGQTTIYFEQFLHEKYDLQY
jgi:hypothetical protein